MSFKVCFMGASFETGNRGVSALAASFIKNIILLRPDAEISFLIGNKVSKQLDIHINDIKARIQIINYRLSPKAKYQEHLLWILMLATLQRIIPFKGINDRIISSNAWLNALKQADVVANIHGGDSFSDIYGFRRFIIYIVDDLIALLMRRELILLPQTYGPFKYTISNFIAAFIMKHSSKIYSRDMQGLDIISSILGSKASLNRIAFCPDIAFTLDSAQLDLKEVIPISNKGHDAVMVGLNVNGLMYNGGYTRQNMFGLKCNYKLFLIELVKRLMEDTRVHLLLIPHTFGPSGNINSDPDACLDLFSLFANTFNNRIHILSREYDQSEIKGIIRSCDFFIGSRMHACIAALSQEIPTVGMAYSGKFLGVFDSVGLGNMVLDGRSVDTYEAVHRVIDCFNKRASLKIDLRKKVEASKNHVRSVFREITNN